MGSRDQDQRRVHRVCRLGGARLESGVHTVHRDRLAPRQVSLGSGYATEAANEALATAFGPAGLHDVVSFTTTSNLRSQHVMQRVGMTRDPSEDFDHPLLTDGPLRRHVLYRLKRADWEGRGPMPTSRAPSLGLAGGCQYRH
jgi:hypothetical protein